MEVLSAVVDWIVGLGASVFLPIVMFIIGLIFGMKPGKAFKAGVMLGIAFTAINALNSALLTGTIAPVAQTAMENSGTGLEYIDVGWNARLDDRMGVAARSHRVPAPDHHQPRDAGPQLDRHPER